MVVVGRGGEAAAQVLTRVVMQLVGACVEAKSAFTAIAARKVEPAAFRFDTARKTDSGLQHRRSPWVQLGVDPRIQVLCRPLNQVVEVVAESAVDLAVLGG